MLFFVDAIARADEIQIKNAIKKINSSIRKSKQLRDKLTASSIDGYEAFVTEREKVEKEIAEITGSLELKRRELEMQQMRVDEVAKVFAKMKEAYGKELIDKFRKLIDDIGWAIINDEYLVNNTKLDHR